MSIPHKETESINEETGAKEVKVETVDYRTPPGEGAETHKENVEVVHQIVDEKPEAGPGVIEKGLAAVGRAAESAKVAITGTKSDKPE